MFLYSQSREKNVRNEPNLLVGSRGTRPRPLHHAIMLHKPKFVLFPSQQMEKEEVICPVEVPKSSVDSEKYRDSPVSEEPLGIRNSNSTFGNNPNNLDHNATARTVDTRFFEMKLPQPQINTNASAENWGCSLGLGIQLLELNIDLDTLFPL